MSDSYESVGLSGQQQLAVSTLNGAVAIIAAAGSGKTTTISHRIVNGIEQGQFAANRVLALSYTNRAAAQLRSKLRALGAEAVTVRTFHSAALAQLQFFWPELAGRPTPRVTGKSELVSLALEETGSKLDSFAVSQEIEWQKYTLTDSDQYRSLGRPLPTEEFLQVAARYEQLKRKRSLIDWEDVLLLALGMMHTEPRVRSYIHSQYRFFTVDEYQDISPLQQALLEAWLGDRPELCVVGDPRQTIYSFAGASSSFLTDFHNRYESATVVELTENYRSSPEIVEFANRVLPESGLVAMGRPGIPVRIHAKSDADYIAKMIAEDLAAGVGPEEIAVLARVNSQLEPIAKALSGMDIRSQTRGGGQFFKRPEVLQAYNLLRALQVTPGDSKPVFQTVSEILSTLGWSVMPNESDRWRALNWFVEVLDELGDNPSVEAYLRELEERARSNHEPLFAAVTLATVHSAKGLEWHSVYLSNVNEGSYPIHQARTEAEIEEERRLFYVAVTRAKRSLNIFTDARAAPSRFLPS